MTASTTACPSCGSAASGKFCSACGASLVARTCTACRADLSAQARFCHRCGRPTREEPGHPAALPRRERTAWIAGGALCVALLALIILHVARGTAAPSAPDMANPGSAGGREVAAAPFAGGAAGAAPDISQMTPRERFDRLFNRVMQAGEQGDTVQVERFTPMALGAYAQLDSVDADARYHAAVLRMQVADFAGALALADTILARTPGHLFGYVVRGTVARFQNDSAAARSASRDFLAHYAAEQRANRIEYREHEPALEEFKQKAESVETTAKTEKTAR
jgi:hypothetical protein